MKTTKPTLKRAGIFVIYLTLASVTVALSLASAGAAVSSTSFISAAYYTFIAIAMGPAALLVLGKSISAPWNRCKSEAILGVFSGLIIGIMLALIW